MEIIFFVAALLGVFLGPMIRDTWIGCHCHGCLEEKRRLKELKEAKVGQVMPKLDDTLWSVLKRGYIVPFLLKCKKRLKEERTD